MKNGFKKVLKILVLGSGGIGKTTFLKLFCYNQYTDGEKLTVGNEIFVKKLNIRGASNFIFLQIWDIGGQERFRSFLEGFFPGSVGALLGFDVKRRNSFFALKEWVDRIRKHNLNLPIVLIGTKTDLGYHPTLNPALAKNFVDEHNLIDFIEISSKEKLNIDKPFKVLIQQIEHCAADDIEFLGLDL